MNIQSMSESVGLSNSGRCFSPLIGRYLRDLLNYFESLYHRTLPLHDLEGDLQAAEQEFEEKWAAGEIEGWGKPKENGNLTESGIWCDACELDRFVGKAVC
jgi:hypothetical protein